ncbi:MAG: hypothetical protein ABIJ09_18345 [Pseudomonadota bacterium]
MSTLRGAAVTVLLAFSCLLSLASLGLIFDGPYDDQSGGPAINDNAALDGCYTQSGGSQMNSYWFDGVSACQNVIWNSLTGTVSYGCTYQVSQGQLDISWDDGSSNSYRVEQANNGITLDGTLYEYSGSSCG